MTTRKKSVKIIQSTKTLASTRPAKRGSRQLDASPDRIDLRDWLYHPRLEPLPDQLVNCQRVPEILDQKNEGACTGFALAAVINFLVHERGIKRRVSPRMLYELARRYDEWPGEQYEGSSARGAMKGWVRHGVCPRDLWKDTLRGAQHLDEKAIAAAKWTPGGAFYRVVHKQVRDVHAALNEVGIVYVTIMVHDGWFSPGPTRVPVECVHKGRRRTLKLPVIQRVGRADGGHAVALVGHTENGFIVQNSWGASWGEGGFALLPYEDYLLHVTDVWAAQLGVPVLADLWETAKAADTTMGMNRAARVIPLSEIRPYVIDVENNGVLSDSGDYWTTEQDLERLFTETIPKATEKWPRKRVMLFLHGGLNSEKDTAARIMAFRDVLLENQIYPLHIMWESDWLNTIKGIFKDKFTDADKRAGGGWFETLSEGTDRVVELTAAKPGGAMWGEMKENACKASTRADGRGAMQLIGAKLAAACKKLGVRIGKNWELHIVAHSAGSIFTAHALPHILDSGLTLNSVQFLAPAISIGDFKTLMLDAIKKGACPTPITYVLGDAAERDDCVGPYRKSLLYLVSNAFEAKRGTPLLGMQACITADADIAKLLNKSASGLPNLIIAGAAGAPGAVSNSSSHGGFDNDVDTLNSVLYRILGKMPARRFESRDLKY